MQKDLGRGGNLIQISSPNETRQEHVDRWRDECEMTLQYIFAFYPSVPVCHRSDR
jgi:hypothetical protein